MQEECGPPPPLGRIQGRGQTEARRAENLFLRPGPHRTLQGLYDQPPPLSSLSEGLDLLLKQDDFYYKVNKIMSSYQKLL